MTSNLPDLDAMMREELHPDLAPYVVDTGTLGPWLKHPLVFGPLTVPGYMNRQYLQKTRTIQEAEAKANWGLYLFLHERPYRMIRLAELWEGDKITGAILRKLLVEVWIDTEFPHQFDGIPLRLFRDAGFITDAPNVWRDALRDPITVFRGDAGRPSQRRGSISWSLSRGMGAWYARRFTPRRGRARLWTGTIWKEDALAYFESRGEAEVVVSPDHVRNMHEEPIGGSE